MDIQNQGRILLVGPGANIEDGSSLIIHLSSGSHKRSTNWANHINYNFGWALQALLVGARGHGPLDPLNPALYRTAFARKTFLLLLLLLMLYVVVMIQTCL